MHGNGPAPKTERDESHVSHQEPECEIVADEAADEAGWSEDSVQMGGVLLDRVGGLRENREQER
jgi:hypothetical protein